MTSEFAVAVHALVFLNHKGDTQSSEAVAENVCTNPARGRKVMARLKRAGLVQTKEGLDGGYHFIKDPARVDLKQVAEAVDARLVSAAWRPGSGEMDCLIASGMADILDSLYQGLDKLCKQKLASVTIADIDCKIFGTRHMNGAQSGNSFI